MTIAAKQGITLQKWLVEVQGLDAVVCSTDVHLKVVKDLKKQMMDLHIQPNINTVIRQLVACQLATLGGQRRAFWGLTAMLVALTEACTLGKADAIIYMKCFKAIQANKDVEQI